MQLCNSFVGIVYERDAITAIHSEELETTIVMRNLLNQIRYGVPTAVLYWIFPRKYCKWCEKEIEWFWPTSEWEDKTFKGDYCQLSPDGYHNP